MTSSELEPKSGAVEASEGLTALAESGEKFPAEMVLFVHGTFAYEESDRASSHDKERWWQRGSDFGDALAAKLPGREVVPAGNRVSEACPPWWWLRRRQQAAAPSDAVFHWSGANLESARRTAGQRLLCHLDRLIRESPRDFHLVGHSHGGGVVWEALCLAFERQHKGKDSLNTLERLKSWTTIATPFMHFGPDWSRLPWAGLCFASFLGLALYERSWLSDFWLWSQRAPEVRRFWASNSYPWYLVLHLGTLLLVLFLLHWSWALFRWMASGPSGTQEEEQTRYDFCSSCITTAGWLILVASIVLSAHYLKPVWLPLPWATAWHWRVLAANLWTIAVIGGLVLPLGSAGSMIRRHSDEKRRRRTSASAWHQLGPKHRALPVGYDAFDEALIGLQAVVEVPEDRILPRIPAPGANRFTRRGYVRQPEYEQERATVGRWVLDFMVLPYSITRDWVVRPFYNDIFAPLVDRFVIRRLWHSAHGSDLRGGRIIGVTPTPDLRYAAVDGQSCIYNPPSASLLRTKSRVRRAVSRYVDRLRRRIGLNSSAAVEILELLKKAMGHPLRHGELLFHTDYFNLPHTAFSLADELADSILGGDKLTYQPPSCPRPPRRRLRPACYSIQYEFFVGTGRLLVVGLLLLMPAAVLGLIGRGLLYPESKDRVAAWATSLAPLGFVRELVLPCKGLLAQNRG